MNFQTYLSTPRRQIERSVAEKPGSSSLRLCLGLKYYADRQYSAAVSHFYAAARLNKNWFAPPLHAGVCHFHLLEFAEAEHYLERAHALGAHGEFLATAKYYLGRIREHESDFFQAQECYLASCAAWPMYLESHKALTRLCSQQPLLRPAGWISPESDEMFHYIAQGRSPECRVRTFRHRHTGEKVVLMTNYPITVQPAVTAVPEAVVAQLSQHLSVPIPGTVWVTHIEKVTTGLHALLQVTFKRFFPRNDDPLLEEVSFRPMDAKKFANITGYRLLW